MEKSNENTIVIQNPDGFIQLGLQPHLGLKKTTSCINCRKNFKSNRDHGYVQCFYCKTINKIIPGNNMGVKPQGFFTVCPNCHGRFVVDGKEGCPSCTK